MFLFGCGKTKYRVDYTGGKEWFDGAKDAYAAGEEVTVYYTLMATDSDVSFYLDGERIPFEYDSQKGFKLSFVMPDHDVTLDVEWVNTMEYDPDSHYEPGVPASEDPGEEDPEDPNAEGNPSGATLVFSSFDGGGPEYDVSIADPSLLDYTVTKEYESEDHDEMTGAGYRVIIDFTGLAAGHTQVTVTSSSPTAPSETMVYEATIDDAGEVTLEQKQMQTMTLEINGETFAVTLDDNPTAAAFAETSSVMMEMTELNGNEKYAYLLDALEADPQPVGHIEAGDLMLYGDDCIVIFYKSFDTPYTYTRIGWIEDPERLAKAVGSGDVDVLFEMP